jgi:hypothetical protein
MTSAETTTNRQLPIPSMSPSVTVTAEVLGPGQKKHSNSGRCPTRTNPISTRPRLTLSAGSGNAQATPHGPPTGEPGPTITGTTVPQGEPEATPYGPPTCPPHPTSIRPRLTISARSETPQVTPHGPPTGESGPTTTGTTVLDEGPEATPHGPPTDKPGPTTYVTTVSPEATVNSLYHRRDVRFVSSGGPPQGDPTTPEPPQETDWATIPPVPRTDVTDWATIPPVPRTNVTGTTGVNPTRTNLPTNKRSSLPSERVKSLSEVQITPITNRPPYTDDGTTIYRSTSSYTRFENRVDGTLVVSELPTSTTPTRRPRPTFVANGDADNATCAINAFATPLSFFLEGVTPEELVRGPVTTCDTSPPAMAAISTRGIDMSSTISATPAVLSHLVPHVDRSTIGSSASPAGRAMPEDGRVHPSGFTSANTAATLMALALVVPVGARVSSFKHFMLAVLSTVTAVALPSVAAQRMNAASGPPASHMACVVPEDKNAPGCSSAVASSTIVATVVAVALFCHLAIRITSLQHFMVAMSFAVIAIVLRPVAAQVTNATNGTDWDGWESWKIDHSHWWGVPVILLGAFAIFGLFAMVPYLVTKYLARRDEKEQARKAEAKQSERNAGSSTSSTSSTRTAEQDATLAKELL